MSIEAWGWIVCGVAFVACITFGHIVQWFTEREDAPVYRGDWNPQTGRRLPSVGEQCGVEVWCEEEEWI